MYNDDRGVGPFVAFFLYATVRIVPPSSCCCVISSWAIVVQSKLGTANVVTL